jgi:hypothetical protein
MVSPVAHATVGGTFVAEVMGWDSKDEKVFVTIHNNSEGVGDGDMLAYFRLDGSRDSLATNVPWESDDSTRAHRLSAIRRRLKPLAEDWEASSIPRSIRIIDSSYVKSHDLWRYNLSVGSPSFRWGGEIQVQVYGSPIVNFHRVYTVPGRPELVVVLAFIGWSAEGGYETQVPVLLRPDTKSPIRVAWARWEP